MTRPSRGPEDYFAPGDWNLICSICGMKMKFSEAVQNWQGAWRHRRCNEPRHPQDFVHALNLPGESGVPVVQKMGEIDIQICTISGLSCIAGYAVATCMIAGRTTLSAL